MSPTTLFLFGLVVFVIWIFRLRETLRFYSGPHILNKFSREALLFPVPKVSIIVPARNEENNIGNCLETLLQQDYPDFEILVVNDRSTDRTAAVIEEWAQKDEKIKLVNIESLPQGWTGKNNALATGVKQANGEWFLFTDADTVHRSRTLSTALGHAMLRKADMISLLPSLATHTFWEEILQPLAGALLMLRFPIQKINNPNSQVAFANGQYILMKKSVLEEVGGLEAVKGTMLEDIALAKRVKGRGHSIHLGYAADLLKTRMYSSLSEIWNGWVRIYYSGFNRNIFVITGMICATLGVALFPYYLFLKTLGMLFSDPLANQSLAFLGLSVALLFVIYPTLLSLFRLVRSSSSPLLFHPVGSLVLLGILGHTWLKIVLRQSVSWKGNSYHEQS